MCLSNVQTFHVAPEFLRMLEPGDGGELRISLGLQCSNLVVSARTDGFRGGPAPEPPPALATGPGSAPGLVVDVTAASQSLLLHHRGIAVSAERVYSRSSTGLCCGLSRRRAVSEALAAGLLCVLCARERRGEGPADSIVRTLNLDEVQPR